MIDKFIELHAHLDGCIDLKLAKELAKISRISLPSNDDKILSDILTVSKNCRDLNDFLKCFELPLSLLQTKDAISHAVYSISESMRNKNVVYSELRFAPQLHTKKGLSQEETVRAALEGVKKCNIPVNLILCLMRSDNNEKENYETLNTAKKYITSCGGVVALDLAGAEALYPTVNFKELFLTAKKDNIPFTIHAGEAAGDESVKAAIEFGAKRIGHGVRISRETAELIKNKDIALEMCPTSNVLTKAVPKIEQHPVLDFLNMGLKVTVNTDDPAIENTTIKKEFERIIPLGLNENKAKKLYYNAADSAFTTHDMKEHLKSLI